MKTAARVLTLLVLVILSFPMRTDAARSDRHIKVPLVPVAGSSVTGFVQLVGGPHGGTLIHVVAQGLQPGSEYLSLYYDNSVCEIEPYSEDDIIGMYTAGDDGVGTTGGKQDDDLDEIGSVSVRAADFTLLACANVHGSGAR